MTTKCTTNYINLKYNISINEKVGVDFKYINKRRIL